MSSSKHIEGLPTGVEIRHDLRPGDIGGIINLQGFYTLKSRAGTIRLRPEWPVHWQSLQPAEGHVGVSGLWIMAIS
ncbi:MAG: hypothetical protein WCA08_14635 [Desulfoferrobacter sp.]